MVTILAIWHISSSVKKKYRFHMFASDGPFSAVGLLVISKVT